MRLDLDVQAHLRHAGVASGVVGGLADRGHERVEPRIHRAVADEHEVDLDVVAILDVGDDPLEGGAERGGVAVAVGRPLVEQPGAQLALLAAGQRAGPARAPRPAG